MIDTLFKRRTGFYNNLFMKKLSIIILIALSATLLFACTKTNDGSPASLPAESGNSSVLSLTEDSLSSCGDVSSCDEDTSLTDDSSSFEDGGSSENVSSSDGVVDLPVIR